MNLRALRVPLVAEHMLRAKTVVPFVSRFSSAPRPFDGGRLS
jgi:hypothetical protein